MSNRAKSGWWAPRYWGSGTTIWNWPFPSVTVWPRSQGGVVQSVPVQRGSKMRIVADDRGCAVPAMYAIPWTNPPAGRRTSCAIGPLSDTPTTKGVGSVKRGADDPDGGS